MKERGHVVVGEPWHVDAIADDARAADVAELWASSRTHPRDAMKRGLASSVSTFTGFFDGVPVCMFGASPFSILGGYGIAWMLGSSALDRLCVQKSLLRHSGPAVDYLQSQFPTLLYNFVDQRNASAIRWLDWLGFEFDDPIPYGVDGLPFLPFYRRGA